MTLPLILAAWAPPSLAAEVQFEGFYRARARGFDTLTLDRDHPQDEGLALYAEHRLWLAPRFLLSDAVGAFVEIRGLDGVVWGDQPGIVPEDLTEFAPVMPEHDLTAPTSSTEETTTLLDLTLWRVYGRADTPIGHFTFGRVPLLWGTGMWLNDGVHVDPFDADYGDTTDRVAWEMLVQDQFWLSAAIDVPIESFIGEMDDTTAFSLSLGYRTETINAGIVARLDHAGERQDLDPFNVFTADAAFDANLGKLHAAAEVLGQFGDGDFEGGLNEANVTAFGATLHADIESDVWKFGVRSGLATGDGQEDLNLKTFTFDRDYSIGMFLFEQPMPVLSEASGAANEANQGRNFDEARTGNAIQNALFVKPTITRTIVEGFSAEISYLYAHVARPLREPGFDQMRSYGSEFQIGLGYDAIEHFEVDARFGAFLPGSAYTINPDNPDDPSGFEDTAFGGQLSARIVF